jgi:hypothetical protein
MLASWLDRAQVVSERWILCPYASRSKKSDSCAASRCCAGHSQRQWVTHPHRAPQMTSMYKRDRMRTAVTVRYFASARAAAGLPSEYVAIGEGATSDRQAARGSAAQGTGRVQHPA